MKEFKYWRLIVCVSGDMELDVSSRLSEGTKMTKGYGCLLRTKGFFIVTKVSVLVGMIAPTLLDSSASGMLNARGKRNV